MKSRLLCLVLALIFCLSLLPAAALAAEDDDVFAFTIAQKAPDDRTVAVTLADLSEIVAKDVDTITVTASMSYKNSVTESDRYSVAISAVDAATGVFELELPYYGKWSVSLSFLAGGSTVYSSDAVEVPVSAAEYNIVCGTATTDVLIDSLKFFTGQIDSSLATIVTLNRYWQYDWDNLPENMYRNPLLSAAENGAAQNWNIRMDHMQQYVKELYEIDPDAVFHFYITDYHMYAFAKICYANGIPGTNYSVTMVTDGSGSYTSFHDAYGEAEDAQAVHDQMVEEYRSFREGVYDGSVTNYSALPSGNIRKYEYAILDVETEESLGANWWVVRKSVDTFALENDPDFQAKVLADTRISNNYINGLLTNMSAAGKDEEFKALYKFVDDGFQAARDEGKKLMMFLGTTATIEKAFPIMDYINFVVTYYGDEYAYFYKGHPGNYLMDLDRYKQPYLDIGVGVLESSIAAELFLYFNPDIEIAGYESSLFQNMITDNRENQNVGLFRRTRQVAEADVNLGSYAGTMDFFLSDLTQLEDPFTYNSESQTATINGYYVNYGNQPDADAYALAHQDRAAVEALIPEGEENDHNYLVQFNNTDTKQVCEYDYAIWNADKGLIHFVAGDLYGGLELASFTITASAGEGGSIDPSGAVAVESGADQRFLITPDDGMEVEDILVDGASVGASRSYTFENVTADATIEVSFKERIALFEDVPEGEWYYKPVYYCYDCGYFVGYSDTIFAPNDTMTRAMFAMVLWRLAGCPKAEGELPFEDVPEDSWYTEPVLWAYANRIIFGTSETTFSPNDPVTREQMVTLLWRYEGNPIAESGDLSAFTDAGDISSWAVDAFKWAVEVGFIRGMGDGTLAPRMSAPRSNVAQLVMNYTTA